MMISMPDPTDLLCARIREAVPSDCSGIADVQVRGWQAAYRGMLPDEYLDGLDPAARLKIWERFVNDGTGRLFVAETNGRIAGFCHVIPSRDPDADCDAEIAAIYVDPDQWRMGYGGRLCTAARGFAIEQGFRHMTLWVLRENSMGRRFYETMGFQVDGATKAEKRLGFVLDEVRYRMELG